MPKKISSDNQLVICFYDDKKCTKTNSVLSGIGQIKKELQICTQITFFNKLDRKTKEKVTYILDIVKFTPMVPEKFLKYIEGTDGLYEIKIKAGSDVFRIFCCFDKGNLVVLFNGFQKKDQKTPKNEILLAEKLKNEYFKSRPKDGK